MAYDKYIYHIYKYMTSVDLQGVCDPLLSVPAEYATIWRHLEACYYRTALQAVTLDVTCTSRAGCLFEFIDRQHQPLSSFNEDHFFTVSTLLSFLTPYLHFMVNALPVFWQQLVAWGLIRTISCNISDRRILEDSPKTLIAVD